MDSHYINEPVRTAEDLVKARDAWLLKYQKKKQPEGFKLFGASKAQAVLPNRLTNPLDNDSSLVPVTSTAGPQQQPSVDPTGAPQSTFAKQPQKLVQPTPVTLDQNVDYPAASSTIVDSATDPTLTTTEPIQYTSGYFGSAAPYIQNEVADAKNAKNFAKREFLPVVDLDPQESILGSAWKAKNMVQEVQRQNTGSLLAERDIKNSLANIKPLEEKLASVIKKYMQATDIHKKSIQGEPVRKELEAFQKEFGNTDTQVAIRESEDEFADIMKDFDNVVDSQTAISDPNAYAGASLGEMDIFVKSDGQMASRQQTFNDFVSLSTSFMSFINVLSTGLAAAGSNTKNILDFTYTAIDPATTTTLNSAKKVLDYGMFLYTEVPKDQEEAKETTKKLAAVNDFIRNVMGGWNSYQDQGLPTTNQGGPVDQTWDASSSQLQQLEYENEAKRAQLMQVAVDLDIEEDMQGYIDNLDKIFERKAYAPMIDSSNTKPRSDYVDNAIEQSTQDSINYGILPPTYVQNKFATQDRMGTMTAYPVIHGDEKNVDIAEAEINRVTNQNTVFSATFMALAAISSGLATNPSKIGFEDQMEPRTYGDSFKSQKAVLYRMFLSAMTSYFIEKMVNGWQTSSPSNFVWQIQNAVQTVLNQLKIELDTLKNSGRYMYNYFTGDSDKPDDSDMDVTVDDGDNQELPDIKEGKGVEMAKKSLKDGAKSAKGVKEAQKIMDAINAYKQTLQEQKPSYTTITPLMKVVDILNELPDFKRGGMQKKPTPGCGFEGCSKTSKKYMVHKKDASDITCSDCYRGYGMTSKRFTPRDSEIIEMENSEDPQHKEYVKQNIDNDYLDNLEEMQPNTMWEEFDNSAGNFDRRFLQRMSADYVINRPYDSPRFKERDMDRLAYLVGMYEHSPEAMTTSQKVNMEALAIKHLDDYKDPEASVPDFTKFDTFSDIKEQLQSNPGFLKRLL